MILFVFGYVFGSFEIDTQGFIVHFYVQFVFINFYLVDGYTLFIAFNKGYLYIRTNNYFGKMVNHLYLCCCRDACQQEQYGEKKFKCVHSQILSIEKCSFKS